VGLGAATLTALNQLPGGVPKGYLRVLVFNEDSALVDQRTVQLTAAALGHYETLATGPLLVQQHGYVTVYVGNESAADVFFDDVTIEHRPGLQVQENQYDPFGLDLAGVSGAAVGLRLKNYYQFNGKENQLDLGLHWNHQDARFYDYQLGRWHVVDPLADEGQENWTPYQGSFNNAATTQA
jgi:RHS repeat-associated protein